MPARPGGGRRVGTPVSALRSAPGRLQAARRRPAWCPRVLTLRCRRPRPGGRPPCRPDPAGSSTRPGASRTTACAGIDSGGPQASAAMGSSVRLAAFSSPVRASPSLSRPQHQHVAVLAATPSETRIVDRRRHLFRELSDEQRSDVLPRCGDWQLRRRDEMVTARRGRGQLRSRGVKKLFRFVDHGETPGRERIKQRPGMSPSFAESPVEAKEAPAIKLCVRLRRRRRR
jgi:hypothetical protein